MSRFLDGFFMCWSMFLYIPCPSQRWSEEARPMMLAAFPLVGLIAGSAWIMAAYLGRLLLPPMLAAVLAAAAPWLVTGFMHLDGYMDVSDAIMSRKDVATKQKILKDSHCGAFAVICVGLLLLAQTAAFADLGERILETRVWLSLLLVPVSVRACAAMAVMGLRPMGVSQYAKMGGGSGTYRRSIQVLGAVLAVLVLAALLFLRSPAPLAAAAGYWLAAMYGFRQLDGMNGDISGFALSIGELAGAAALAVFGA